MSAYPTSATLAAFRMTLHDAQGPHFTDDCGITDPPEGMAAWEDELAAGIGYRDAIARPADYAVWRSVDVVALARREAAALRSRAYEAIRADALGDAGLADDLHAAIGTFVPEPMDPAFGPAFDEAYRR